MRPLQEGVADLRGFKTIAQVMALVLAMVALPTVGTALAATEDEHIHVRATNHPVDGKPIPAEKYTFNLVIQTHAMPGVVTSVRVGDGSTVKQTKAINVTNATSPQTIPFTVDFSTWAPGRHELRWTANRPAANGLPRLYQSTGWEICIVSCTPNLTSGRGSFPTAPFIEARGWQADYANVRITTAFGDLRGGGTFKVRAANTATKGFCTMNPNFHAGSSGTILGRFGTSTVTLTIPSSYGPGDKLVCVAGQGTRAGVLALVLPTSPNVTTGDMESQVWWNSTGLVVQ